MALTLGQNFSRFLNQENFPVKNVKKSLTCPWKLDLLVVAAEKYTKCSI